MKRYVLAIDGPAGSGKSTVSKLVAKKLDGFVYLDTGAMYRMITYKCLENNIQVEEIEKIKKILEETNFDIKEDKFFLDNKDVSFDIRTKEVTSNVSKYAAVKIIREKLVDIQRKISEGKKIVIDGRDIGTVVFPDAELKIFLVASPEERANRRVKDYESKGIKADYNETLKEIIKRDKLDSEREESPLKKAEDAIELDTSKLTIDEVVEKILSYMKI
ncbi:cytidylate kinase [Hypnocyclicus thermotrophus]|uniref:Cytidylate kinase n=1 Tax=Hypnocyclicus thermotrophus TaxID=1627895 RepID=A0AA46DXW6_9FUSO|nr:(d)CMP kinase [Hypnocyclicus thermotrophus]TDT69162.1 cytidylate kinase [Hypnocyclicus thermotrophus]